MKVSKMIINERYIMDIDDEDDVVVTSPIEKHNIYTHGFAMDVCCSNYCAEHEDVFGTEMSTFLEGFVDSLEYCQGVGDDIDVLLVTREAFIISAEAHMFKYGGINVRTTLTRDEFQQNTEFKVLLYLNFDFKNVN